MKKIFLTAVLFLSFFLVFSQAWAAGLVPCGGEGQPECQPCHLFVMLNNIIQFVFLKLIPPLAGLLIAIGGGMFLLAGGNPSTINQAKSLLMAVVIGLVIIYGCWLILG